MRTVYCYVIESAAELSALEISIASVLHADPEAKIAALVAEDVKGETICVPWWKLRKRGLSALMDQLLDVVQTVEPLAETVVRISPRTLVTAPPPELTTDLLCAGTPDQVRRGYYVMRMTLLKSLAIWPPCKCQEFAIGRQVKKMGKTARYAGWNENFLNGINLHAGNDFEKFREVRAITFANKIAAPDPEKVRLAAMREALRAIVENVPFRWSAVFPDYVEPGEEDPAALLPPPP